MIIPPTEIRIIIEKLAAYVIKNGKAFEDKILEKERHNPKFSFLLQNDPYRPYYQRRLHEYQQVGPEGVDSLLQRNQELDVPKSEPLVQKLVPSKKAEAPKEPEPLNFLIDLPSLSALDYDVIKLTALYVARNGRHFMLALSQRESRNPQFDFLKPNHSLHRLFLCLVEQYTCIIIPSTEMVERLTLNSTKKFRVLDRVMERVEFTRYFREQQLKEEEIAEKERLAFASIDWHDFVVVETIDFGQNEHSMEFPKPLTQSIIRNMSLVQKQELWNGKTILGNQSKLQEEMEMDVETIINEAPQSKRTAIPAPQNVPYNAPSPYGNVRRDYIPKAQAQPPRSGEGIEICPICNQSFPKSQIEEHIRVEKLDPKWKEQRDRHLAKHRETNYITSGVEFTKNLEAMQQTRITLNQMGHETAELALRQANRQASAQSVIWDGRADPNSIGQVTREAMQKAKPIIQAQMAHLAASQQPNPQQKQ